MAMMEAQGRHETFVTSAQSLKKDERRELQIFKDRNRRIIHQNSAYNESAGVSNLPTQVQSKGSSMAGGKLDKRGGKRSGQQLPAIQAFDQRAQEYFQKYPSQENQILYQEPDDEELAANQ